MIDQTDNQLQEWIKSVVAGVQVHLGVPGQLEDQRGISLYLLALVEPPQAWINRQPGWRVALRYLITAWSPDEREAHRLLGKLLLAALEKPEYEIDLSELPPTLWSAFGIAPRPAFTLCLPLPLARVEPVPPLVQGHLVVRGEPVPSLYGIVLGPGDIPIAGAGVELPSLQLRGYTNAEGRFRFSTVPGGSRHIQLVVRAKGRVQSVFVERPSSEQEPLEIRFVALNVR